MLVLSRRTDERIVFPGLDVRVQVLAARPGAVRLGIEAPPGVVVLREEVVPAKAPQPETPKLRHLMRNCLNAAAIGLALMRQQLQRGLHANLGATLEKVEEEVSRLREHLEKESAAARAAAPAPRCRALLVEDDHNERELLAGFLRLAGIEVDTVDDGTGALDHLRTQRRPDFLLLDMAMPRCDGAAVLRALRDGPPTAMKVFALTGYTPEHFRLDPAASGVTRWFQKPIRPEALLRALRQEQTAAG